MSETALTIDFSSKAQQHFGTTGNPAFAWHELGHLIAAKEQDSAVDIGLSAFLRSADV